MEVKWGIIRLISSGILGPTNKVFSVQEVIPELARSRAILHFPLFPLSSLQDSERGYDIKGPDGPDVTCHCITLLPPRTPPPTPHNTLPPCHARDEFVCFKSFICSYSQCGD